MTFVLPRCARGWKINYPPQRPFCVFPDGSAYCHFTVHLNTSYNELASPTRPVNDSPSRPFPAPPRRRQFSTGGVFDAPTSDSNPFTPTSHFHDHSQPPIHPDLRTSTVSSPTIVPEKPQPSPPPTTALAYPYHGSNPFVARAAAAAAAKLNSSPERKLPPLPPRKVPPLPPPRSAHPLVSTPGTPSKPLPPPLPAKVPHLTTALMQQSLQASKAGQEAKRIETQREQERVLQVLKSSTQNGSPPKRPGVGGGNSRSSMDGAGSTIPVLPPRPRVSPTASVTSTRSFEQVAGASLASHRSLQRSRSPLRPRSLSRSGSHSPPSPSRPTTDLPPPMHPNRKTTQAEYTTDSTAVSSPSARLGRSKSTIHYPSPPPVPRRRRPDSVQALPPPGTNSSALTPLSLHTPSATSTSTATGTFPRLHRHLSLSTREPLWDDMRDTLSAVRYKAEAGFSRRGWVPGLDRDERLIAERRESGVPSASSSEDGLGVDAESPENKERRHGSLERDEMKWPTGNGWRPLA
jgi:hypothetical protein